MKNLFFVSVLSTMFLSACGSDVNERESSNKKNAPIISSSLVKTAIQTTSMYSDNSVVDGIAAANKVCDCFSKMQDLRDQAERLAAGFKFLECTGMMNSYTKEFAARAAPDDSTSLKTYQGIIALKLLKYAVTNHEKE